MPWQPALLLSLATAALALPGVVSAAEPAPDSPEAGVPGESGPQAPPVALGGRRGDRIADSYREGRHMGLGFTALGPSVTAGLYLEVMPIQFVGITGGWGWFFLVNQTWWVEVKAMPIRGAWTPCIGGGLAGELISPASRGDDGQPGSYLWRDEDDPLSPVYPFLRVGAMRMWETGLTFQFGLLVLFDGPNHIPLIPWPDLRLGWHF